MESKFNLYDSLVASVFILNVFVVVLFFIRNYKISTTYKLTGITLLLILLRTFLTHLSLSGDIIHYPHLLLVSHLVSKIGLPLLFLILYFEVYQTKFKWYDFFHFLPALIFFFNYWDLFMQSADYKIDLIKKMNLDGYDIVWDEGSFLNEEYVYLLRVLPFIFYLAAISVLFFRSRDCKHISWELRQFFKVMVIFLALNIIPVILTIVYPVIKSNDVVEIAMMGYASNLFMLVSFFFVPGFLYQPYFSRINSVSEEINKDEGLMQENMERLQRIEEYFNTHRAFLDPEYCISKLEKELQIPARLISKTIKATKDQNFNQFINEYRINYLLNNVKVEEALNTPVNQLSYQAGFNSVNNFYAHFKNYVGCTPKVHFENLMLNK